jgi:hypothetical protein
MYISWAGKNINQGKVPGIFGLRCDFNGVGSFVARKNNERVDI